MAYDCPDGKAIMNSTAAVLLADKFFSKTRLNDVSLVLGSILLITLSAQIQIPMFPVPMTMQTFAVLLVAASLGINRAAVATTGYLGLGALGLPVFAGTKTLAGVLPTAGYLVGFVFASMLVGFLASKGLSKTPVKVLLSFAAGSAVIYAFGVAGLMAALGLDIVTAISVGVIPFLIGDVVKAALAAALLPTAWKLSNNR